MIRDGSHVGVVFILLHSTPHLPGTLSKNLKNHKKNCIYVVCTKTYDLRFWICLQYIHNHPKQEIVINFKTYSIYFNKQSPMYCKTQFLKLCLEFNQFIFMKLAGNNIFLYFCILPRERERKYVYDGKNTLYALIKSKRGLYNNCIGLVHFVRPLERL